MNPPSAIAHYRIVCKIGEGGMGEVWRATDTKLNRDIAIKVLPAAFANDPDRLRRFLLEAQAAGSLNYPNIVAVYDARVSDGTAYLVTELLEGETLRQRHGAGMARNGRGSSWYRRTGPRSACSGRFVLRRTASRMRTPRNTIPPGYLSSMVLIEKMTPHRLLAGL